MRPTRLDGPPGVWEDTYGKVRTRVRPGGPGCREGNLPGETVPETTHSQRTSHWLYLVPTLEIDRNRRRQTSNSLQETPYNDRRDRKSCSKPKSHNFPRPFRSDSLGGELDTSHFFWARRKDDDESKRPERDKGRTLRLETGINGETVKPTGSGGQ